jgi:carboxylesterase type B
MLASILALAIVFCTPVVWGAVSDPQLLVKTTSGVVKGYLDTNRTSVPLRKWYGVPFAQDTSGANRWRPPQPAKYSSSVFEASAFGPACMQGRADGGNGA